MVRFTKLQKMVSYRKSLSEFAGLLRMENHANTVVLKVTLSQISSKLGRVTILLLYQKKEI